MENQISMMMQHSIGLLSNLTSCLVSTPENVSCLVVITQCYVHEQNAKSNWGMLLQALADKEAALAKQKEEADLLAGQWQGMFEAAQTIVNNTSTRATDLEGQLQATRTKVDQLRLSSAQQAEVSSWCHSVKSPIVFTQQVGLISFSISVVMVYIIGVHQLHPCHCMSLSSSMSPEVTSTRLLRLLGASG